MISIVSSYFNDALLFESYWLPMIYKHPEVEFIVVDDFSQDSKLTTVAQGLKNFKGYYITEDKKFNSHGARNLAVSEASNQTVFMTDMDALPTYELICRLKETAGQNKMIWPSWHHYRPNPYAGTPCPNEFSVLKDSFIAIKGYDEEVGQQGGWFGDWWTRRNYIEQFRPEVIKAYELYFLEEFNGDRKDHKVRDRVLEEKLKKKVWDRNARRDWSNKPWLSFKWERTV